MLTIFSNIYVSNHIENPYPNKGLGVLDLDDHCAVITLFHTMNTFNYYPTIWLQK